jgi:putative oxidoreductase
MIPLLFIFSDLALFLLRVFLGTLFIAHGLPKIKDLRVNAGNFEQMGFKPGMLWGTIAAVVEVVGGALLVVGLLTQVVAGIVAVEMLVAALWRKKTGAKFAGGYEFELLLVLALLALTATGSTLFSVDGYFNLVLLYR